MRSTLGKIIGIVLSGALVVGFVLVFRVIVGQEGAKLDNGQPYSPPGEVLSEAVANTPEAYPQPEEMLSEFSEPSPEVGGTSYPAPSPWLTFTPYPSPTLGPGPTTTPVPLVTPAKNAAGTILYLASGKQDTAALYALQVDANGVALETASKRSEDLDVTWGRAYPSLDGSRIVLFGGQCASAILYPETGRVEAMFKDSLGVCGRFLDWHPDSRHLLIIAENRIPGLWLVDTDTWEFTTLVVPGDFGILGGAVSSDGQKVVYSYQKGFDPSEIWMVNANGRDPRQLFTTGGSATNFSWSPDGSQIAFLGNGLMVMSSDGTNAKKFEGVTHGPRLFPPNWSPDSRILSILSSPESSPYLDPWKPDVFKNANIYLVDVETGKEWPLLEDSSINNLYPTWSPDGSQIAFISNFSGTSEIWVVNVDGSNLRQLTTAGKDVRFPYWRK